MSPAMAMLGWGAAMFFLGMIAGAVTALYIATKLARFGRAD